MSSRRDQIIINHDDRNYQWETLEALGVARNKIINVDRGLVLQVDELVVPSLKSTNERLPEKHIQFLRQRFLSDGTCKRRRRIFLSRKDAFHRRLLNEDEVIAIFSEYGFERVSLTGMPVREQAKLFAESEIIAGPSGAGFANLVFATPGAAVVELASPGWLTPFHWMISSRLGLAHFVVPTSEGAPKVVPQIRERAAHQRIEPHKIISVLQSVMTKLPASRISLGQRAEI